MTRGTGTPETVIRGEASAVTPQDVVLRSAGVDVAAVAEAVRSMTGLDPEAARQLVARAPSVLRTRIAPALAEALRVKLVALGAAVEVRAHDPAAVERFDVFLQDQGASKIQVVRALKQLLGLELREAVELVDDAPTVVRRKADRDEAEALRHELTEAGARVEVRPHDAATPEPAVRRDPPPSPSASTPSPSTPSPASASSAGGRVFDVILQDHGVHKIAVIKAIRTVTSLGLKEAKDIAEAAGSAVKKGVSEAEARAIEREIVSAGGRVTLHGHDAPAAAPAPAPAPTPAAAGFDVVLQNCGPRKIEVIKRIREVTGLGLREAKDLSETPGSLIKQGMAAAEARALERHLIDAGASVELRPRGGPADEGAPVDVFLLSHGPNKIQVIKIVRELTGLGLKDTKDLVEAAPQRIQQRVSPAAAREVERRLVEVGATVSLR